MSRKRLPGLRVLRGGDQSVTSARTHPWSCAGVRGHEKFMRAVVAAFQRRPQIALQQRCKRLLVFPLWVLRRERFTRSATKLKLNRHGCHSKACRHCRRSRCVRSTGTKSGESGLVTFSTKAMMGLLRRAVIPRWQRIGGSRNDGGEPQRNDGGNDKNGLERHSLYGRIWRAVS